MGRSIVLCGYTGSGKSTVGSELARQLHYTFLDTDQLIEKRLGMSITELVNTQGADAFRDVEHDITREVCEISDHVISTGGGLMTFERNSSLIKDKATIIYIIRDFEQCYQVLAQHPDRPIFRNNTREALLARYNTRHEIYHRIADLEITNSGTPENTAAIIISLLNL